MICVRCVLPTGAVARRGLAPSREVSLSNEIPGVWWGRFGGRRSGVELWRPHFQSHAHALSVRQAANFPIRPSTQKAVVRLRASEPVHAQV